MNKDEELKWLEELRLNVQSEQCKLFCQLMELIAVERRILAMQLEIESEMQKARSLVS
ncbi:MAG: hypothetical protein AB1478_09070 [Nitrospirota bacterium]